MSDSLRPHESQYARPRCPSPTTGVYPNSCPSSWWCHPTIPSSVVPCSSCLQSFPASGSFPMSQFFTSCGQSTGASASVLLMNIQGWLPLGLTGLIPLLSKGLSTTHADMGFKLDYVTFPGQQNVSTRTECSISICFFCLVPKVRIQSRITTKAHLR